MPDSGPEVNPNIPYPEQNPHTVGGVPTPLDKQFAAFLKKKRGELTYRAFGQKIGLPPSTIFRIEQGQQSITLGRLHTVLSKLKCRVEDVFRE